MHNYKRTVMCKMQMLVKLLLYMSHQLKKLQDDRIRKNWYKQFQPCHGSSICKFEF